MNGAEVAAAAFRDERTPLADASPDAALRSPHLQSIKKSWAWLLAVLLVLSFVVQWGAVAYVILCGMNIDPRILYPVGVAPPLMFFASAKYLFR